MVTAKNFVVWIAGAIIMLGLGLFGTNVMFNWAKVGAPDLQQLSPTGPFWLGLGALLLLVTFLGAAWFASSKHSRTWGGFTIILVLAVLAFGLGGWGFTLKDWKWSQFWLGILESVLFMAAILVMAAAHFLSDKK